MTRSSPPPVKAEVVVPEPEEDAVLVDDDTPVTSLTPGESLELDETLEVEVSDPEPSERGASRALVPLDPLDSYLREISRFSQMSREEEREVAIRYFQEKDVEAARKLVTSNLWLVVKIARDYQSAAKNLLDLIQEGNMGLMEAVKNFDPYREIRFPSYATWWIKAYIVRYVIANLRLVKLGTTQAQRKLFFNLRKEKERLEREGFFPAPKLLAERLDVRESDVIEMEQRLGSPDMSVHTPLSADGDADLLSVLPAEHLSAEDAVAQKELRQQLRGALEHFASTLKEKERVIFEERLLGEEKATLQDLAEKFSLSRERVRQLETRIRDKLKDFLKEKFGSSLEQRDFDV